MDKTTLFSIGEFSQISGASIKSLHYYEKINILQPAWIDPENGYRYYTLKQLPFLNLIGLFLDLDIRLNHLTNEFMDEFKKIDYQSLLSYGKSVTQEKIKELNNKMRYIDFLEKTLATNNSLHIVSPYSVL